MPNKSSILIVDDDPRLRKTLSDILSIKGYDPITVEHGEAAVQELNNKDIAVALIDLKLEDMTGVELLKKTKEIRPLTECILITGHASQTSAIDAINLGAYSYILKPYNMEQLLVIVQRAVEKKIAETSLKESEERFSVAFRSSPDAIILTKQESQELVDVNDSFLNMTGYTRDELIGRKMSEINYWIKKNEREYFYDNLNNKGATKNFEFSFFKKNGETGFGLLSADIIEISGEKHLLSTINDISDRKTAEAKVQRQLKQLRALREIDNLITGSVDLRLTLNTIAKNAHNGLGIDAVDFLLFNPNNQMLEHYISYGNISEKLSHKSIRLGNSLAGKAALERKFVKSSDSQSRNDPLVNQLDNEGISSYYAIPLITKGQIKGVMELYSHSSIVENSEWTEFMKTLADQAAIAIDNISLFEKLERSNFDLTIAYDATLEGWAKALELRDTETKGHSVSVTDMTVRLARHIGIDSNMLVHIRRGALLHDIGKMGIPDSILLKPGPLSEDEWVLMKRHPQFAYDMLSSIEFLRPSLEIPYCHHEKWDGTGYPRGLSGIEIPLSARIFSVVDVYDALVSDRPYRRAMSSETAIQYITEQSGKHFDPEIVPIFLDGIRQS